MRFDSTNTFLTVTSLAMFSVTSILVGLLVCGPDTGVAADCDPAALTIQCPDGFVCNESGFCEEVDLPPPMPPCSPGQRVSECVCPDHLEVRDEVCDTPPTDSVCEHADVAELLARLHTSCREVGSGLAPGQLEAATESGCSPAALRSVIIDNHDLTLKIARSFPAQSFTLHFDIGTPQAKRAARWPGNGRPALVKVVKDMLTGVGPEGFLLFVSFASLVGPKELNYELAVRRSDAGVGLAVKALGDFPALGKALTDLKIIVGIVGDEQSTALDLATFDALWGTTGRFHAWDEVSTERMKKDLAAWRAGELVDRERDWLLRTVQQSVVVLPLPCAADEAHG